MSYADIVEVLAHITADTTEVDTAQKAVDKLADDWVDTKTKILQEVPHVISYINRLISQAQHVARQFNISLDPLATALLEMIMTTITSAIAMQQTYVAMGPWGIPFLVLGALALGAAIGSHVKAIESLARARASGQHAERAFSEIRQIQSGLGGM